MRRIPELPYFLYFNLFIKESIGFKVLALVTLRGDFDAIIECIPPLMIDFVCVTKLVNLACNIEKIKILLIHIQRDWRSWTIKSEFEILHRFAESGRSITVAYAGGMYAFGSLFPFLAIIPKIIGKNVTSEYSTRPVGFPYHVEYYVDLDKYYYPVLIHNYLTTAIRLTTLVATDTFVTILVQHCCALFSVVRYRLEYIRKSIEQDKELALLEEDDKFYKNFTYCIQKHKDVLRFARCLDAIYTKAFFFEVGLIILAMTLSALQATTRTLNPHLAIRHASYITAQLLHLYIVCWLGQQVIDHSGRVYTSTYQGEWYESSAKSRKLLNMIMLRSISPCTLTVGKIMILSFPSFSAVINNVQDVDRLVKLIAYLNGILFTIFFVNWQGQKVIDSSEKVFESAYNTEWYSMPIAARKLLIMIMMRSEKPLGLRMGKIVVLSYITFNTVLRTSSSYFMLLRSL
ncbi:odorant receptor 4 [Mycetomoellerius zeteki]|uniref:odorant receptor 4 n=1 Tax=Mycetomoellerius zeteki TaxID=64791 RepID=UPI00084EB45F|nr:PREDICTED: odorant receptor 4-like [Trachymyrmex zeteki]